jgi:hypothetical protein
MPQHPPPQRKNFPHTLEANHHQSKTPLIDPAPFLNQPQEGFAVTHRATVLGIFPVQ